MRLRIVDFFITGLNIPDSPRCNNLHIRAECLNGQLEANLIVALAGAAVADRICALFHGNLSNSLCDNRSCKGCAEQILALIDSARLDGREHIIVDKFIGEILNIEL